MASGRCARVEAQQTAEGVASFLQARAPLPKLATPSDRGANNGFSAQRSRPVVSSHGAVSCTAGSPEPRHVVAWRVAWCDGVMDKSHGGVHRQENHEACGGEQICRDLPIAPSTYYAHKVFPRDPEGRSDRVKRDEQLRPKIRKVFESKRSVYGARKIWRQMHRKGLSVARCTVERLMREMCLQGASGAGSSKRNIIWR